MKRLRALTLILTLALGLGTWTWSWALTIDSETRLVYPATEGEPPFYELFTDGGDAGWELYGLYVDTDGDWRLDSYVTLDPDLLRAGWKEVSPFFKDVEPIPVHPRARVMADDRLLQDTRRTQLVLEAPKPEDARNADRRKSVTYARFAR